MLYPDVISRNSEGLVVVCESRPLPDLSFSPSLSISISLS